VCSSDLDRKGGLFYEELVSPNNKPVQTRIRRVRATRVK
jgi:hypothetical protein